MSSFDTAIERAVAVAGGVCVVAAQGSGIAQGAATIAAGSAGLLALMSMATRKSRAECDAHFARLAADTKRTLLARNPRYAEEYEEASERLSTHLLASFPDPARLATLALSSRGFTAEATDSVLEDLRLKGHGFDRDPQYADFARHVVSTAVECAWEDREYFPKIEPHAWKAALQALGSIHDNTDELLTGQGLLSAKLDDVLSRLVRDDLILESRIRLELDRIRAEGRIRDLALTNFFLSIGEKAAPLADVPELLSQFAERYNGLVARLGRITDLPATIETTRADALAALTAGDLEAAEARWASLERDYSRWLVDQISAVEQSRRDHSTIIREQAAIAMMRLDHLRAAELYCTAARALPADDTDTRRETLLEASSALHNFSELYFDQQSLARAIHLIANEALPLTDRTGDPQNWGSTYNNLGVSVLLQGMRGNSASLREAVEIFRTLLSSNVIGEGLRLTVATHLAHARAYQGESGDHLAMAEAQSILEDLLPRIDQTAYPAEWVNARNALGSVLQARGERNNEHDNISRAVSMYKEALGALGPDCRSRLWAAIQNNLGDCLVALGARGDANALEEGGAAMRLALTATSRAADGALWAALRNNLGKALYTRAYLGEPDAAAEAVKEYELALEALTFEGAPQQWLTTKVALGHALEFVGWHKEDIASLRRAEACYCVAINLSPDPPAFRTDVERDLEGVRKKLRAASSW